MAVTIIHRRTSKTATGKRRSLRHCVGLGLLICHLQAGAADPKGTLNLSLDNDLWGSGNDRHYTHGTQLSYATNTYQPRWLLDAASLMPFYESNDDTRLVWTLGQKIYTPSDLTRSDLIVDDRPYAGWLYASLGLVTDHRAAHRHVDQLELIVGLVGPDSGAESVQRRVHKWTNSEIPQGWGNQLDDELTLGLSYRRQWMLPIFTDYIDVVPAVGFQIGTAMRYVDTGITLRVGSGIGSDYGPPLIEPAMAGTGYFQPSQAFFWYVFAGVSGRYVEHNLFLEGNSDKPSHSVEPEEWVGAIQAGLVMGLGSWRLSVTNIFRSREFEGQQDPDEFGSIGLSYRF